MYRKKMFSWNPSIVDNYGRPCGPTIANWSAMRKFGVNIDSGGVRYDAQRTYPWGGKNSKFNTLNVGSVSASSLYIPDGTYA